MNFGTEDDLCFSHNFVRYLRQILAWRTEFLLAYCVFNFFYWGSASVYLLGYPWLCNRVYGWE